MLFGKEYGSVASLVSEIYKNEKDGMLKLAKRMSGFYGSEIGNVAVFAIFLLASPESYLEQNRMAFSRLCNTLSQMTRKTDAEKPLSEQEKFFAQYGMANQKNFSDLVTNAVLVSGTNDLMLEDENGDIGHFDWFSFSNYGVSCSAEMLSTLALLDAGVANSPAYDRTITKQKFTEAQRSVAKSLYFGWDFWYGDNVLSVVTDSLDDTKEENILLQEQDVEEIEIDLNDLPDVDSTASDSESEVSAS